MAEGAAAPCSEPARGAGGWSLARRVGFRFFFVYFVLYSFPFPVGHLPWTEALASRYARLWYAVDPWVGRHVLGIGREIPVGPNGSGDTTADYVQVFCLAVLSALATLVWSLLACARAHPRLAAGLRLYLRYVLASTMLSYGFAKVFKAQFPFPEPGRLLETYGDSSPMGLLWTFMGASTAYTIFSGLGEVLGGGLLFFRRTTTLGALVLTGVLANIVVLNFSYDVPVKLYSSHLLAMTCALLLPDGRRLLGFLVLNRRVEPLPLARAAGRARHALLAAKLLFVGVICYGTIRQGYEAYFQWGDGAPLPALHGLYEVEEFVRVEPLPAGPDDGAGHADPGRWRRLAVNKWGCTVERADEERVGYGMSYDEAAGTLSLTDFAGSPRHSFTLSRLAPDVLELSGTLDGSEVAMTLRRVDLKSLLLVGRGFHWINEFPYNR